MNSAGADTALNFSNKNCVIFNLGTRNYGNISSFVSEFGNLSAKNFLVTIVSVPSTFCKKSGSSNIQSVKAELVGCSKPEVTFNNSTGDWSFTIPSVTITGGSITGVYSCSSAEVCSTQTYLIIGDITTV